MILVINGRCVFCEGRILIQRTRRADGVENLVYHARCSRVAEAEREGRTW